MEKIFVFGHKNPDTDSVCASICLSYLKNKLGENTEPRVLGNLNKESKFVLDYFKIKEPKFLNDVKVQIQNMHYEKGAMIEEHQSIYKTYKNLMQHGYTGLPLVNYKNKLTGYVNVKEISKYLIDGDLTYLNTNYANILETLHATQILQFDDKIEGKILAATYKSETLINDISLNKKDILIVGNRYKIMEYAVMSGIHLLILVNNIELPQELMDIAKSNKVNVISVPIDTYECANMLKLCNYVKLININPNPISFSIYDYRDDFIEITTKYGHTNYPIVNKENKCLGMIRLIDQNTFDKKKVILVDHNQSSQSVDGIEEAEIMEVLDHHNLGTIGTSIPINFRSMPVGCTCTLLYKLFEEANVEIPKDIAGLMLSAILSDTLLFKSPTTTEIDKIIVKELSKIAKLDYEKYGMEMLKAGATLKGKTKEEVLNMDFKNFTIGENKVGIGQVFILDIDEINQEKQEYIDLINQTAENKKYDVITLFATDIIKNGSYIYFNDTSKNILENGFNVKNLEQGYYLEGMVSRKKQMLPNIMEEIEKK